MKKTFTLIAIAAVAVMGYFATDLSTYNVFSEETESVLTTIDEGNTVPYIERLMQVDVANENIFAQRVEEAAKVVEEKAETEEESQMEAEDNAKSAKVNNKVVEQESSKKEIVEEVNTAEKVVSSETSQPSSSSSKQTSSIEITTSKAKNINKSTQTSAASKPKTQSTIGANKIGVNGIYKSYANYGRASTDTLQSGIDAGLIVAGISNFNGNDGQTTYFGGHNPGIMKFMENNISMGATVTVTDASGTAHNYRMVDKAQVDSSGEGYLNSIGYHVLDAYYYGTDAESILIQFCNSWNNLMVFWYGVKI